MPTPVNDPVVIGSIEAAYLLTVYRAERLVRRRLAGEAPPPRHPVRLPPRLDAFAELVLAPATQVLPDDRYRGAEAPQVAVLC